MQKEPMNILERLAIMTFIGMVISVVVRGCYYN